MLATIEQGADGESVKPYVKLYSRREIRRLFSEFEIEDVIGPSGDGRTFLSTALARLMRPVIPKLEGLMGWYVACSARKPG